MGRPYRQQIERIPETVAWAESLDLEDLRASLLQLPGKNLIAVGSGGSHAAAVFAAQLHESTLGGTAKALTPLEALSRPTSPNTAILLLSGRGNNPDILRSFEALSSRAYTEVGALCATRDSALSRRMAERGHFVFEFQPPGGRDGFLATNSLVATLVVLARAYTSVVDREFSGISISEPAHSWDDSDLMGIVARRDTVFALAEGWGTTAAYDLESRFTEASLANVSVTDYRNFAHGRHYWLDRRRSSSGIISFETPEAERLASRTLHLLPDDIPILRVLASHDGPSGAIELVCASLELALVAGDVRGTDPGRPTVANFGRKLYRGSIAIGSTGFRQGWVDRKATALGLPPISCRDSVEKALTDYLARLKSAQIRGLALDYDGTLCSATNRFLGMDAAIRDELARILSYGIPLAIVTGRGKSAHAQIREAIPRKFWEQVTLGLYNGASILPLDQEMETHGMFASELEDLQGRLLRLSEFIPIEIDVKRYQMSVTVLSGLSLGAARAAIEEALKPIAPNIQIRTSAHSIDIFPQHISKVLAVNCLEEQLTPPVSNDAIIRIGDRGSLHGNDFELLNSGLSLSCSDVSGNLDACWYLGPRGAIGPPATLAYLRALSYDSNGYMTFDVKKLRKVV